jgi:hypothetical protein
MISRVLENLPTDCEIWLVERVSLASTAINFPFGPSSPTNSQYFRPWSLFGSTLAANCWREPFVCENFQSPAHHPQPRCDFEGGKRGWKRGWKRKRKRGQAHMLGRKGEKGTQLVLRRYSIAPAAFAVNSEFVSTAVETRSRALLWLLIR